jgi:hypothetical protein
MQVLAGIVVLAQFVLGIIVLIKLFQEKGALHGILGFFCGIYTFVWGWMNADRLNIKGIMIAWTIALLAWGGLVVMMPRPVVTP